MTIVLAVDKMVVRMGSTKGLDAHARAIKE